ncbi:sulfite exporter TauE/SafE family protein [Halovulum dunhuangense]|uniref:Probable membrane transporter protein n=1 Tax=Halovulum dunhuangense TaxID=1505036 RepID=A0A849L423_9RHOB|nr:sulfite exporter TauE/SafE family protein [Halovulum dunhuangense]NNU81085.1 sulfite exporter TauE/SafE family protein [Halovulum dunhuangense]
MTADLFHAGLGWPIATALIALSFVTSFITAAFGIGGGIIMLATLASLLPGPAIIPVHGLVQLGANGGRAVMLFRHLYKPVLVPFIVGTGIGVALAGSVVVNLPAAWIQIGVGGFILWSVFSTPPGFLRRSAGLAGFVSSALSMFFGGTGPFVAAFLKAQGLGRMAQVATHSTLMSTQHLLKTVTFAILGFAFSQWVGLVALLVVIGFLGTLAGGKVLARIDERRFRLVLSGILILLALRLIYAGASQLYAGGAAPA